MIQWASSVLEPLILPFPSCSFTQREVYSSRHKRVKQRSESFSIFRFPFFIGHLLLPRRITNAKLTNDK